MEIAPVPDSRLLILDGAETVLVVGDLHLGIEEEWQSKGFTVPTQTETIAGDIAETARDRAADRIVLVGDVKHNIPYATYNEEREIGRFFETLLDAVDRVDIARGNHDAGMEDYLPDTVHLRDAHGFTIAEAGFAHGHTWPADTVADVDVLVIGHVHPAVAFVDHLGARKKETCWLRIDVTDGFRTRYDGADPLVVVVPAANPLLGGSAVNEETPPGPLFANDMLDLAGARVTTLDGIDLGELGDIRKGEETRSPPDDAG